MTVKVSGESIAKTSFTDGGTAIGDGETFTVTTAPGEIPEATDVSIKVTLSGDNYKVEGSFNVPKGKEPTDKTELKWETLADVSTATMDVKALTLTGAFADGTFTVESGSYIAAAIEDPVKTGTVTIPYDKIGQDLKTAASDATATVNWGTDGEAFNGSGEWTDLESGDITLSDVPTNTESIYVKVGLTGSSAGTYKSGAISITFEETEATVDSEVSFTKEPAEAEQATVTSIALSLSSISTFSENAPTEETENAITLTPPSGVTPETPIKGKLAQNGTVTFTESINLTATDQDTLKTGWKISATWNNSSSKACTITEVEVDASKVTYTSGENKLSFDASGLTITVASD